MSEGAAGEAWERGIKRIERGERQWRSQRRRSGTERITLRSRKMKSETDALFDMAAVAIHAADYWAAGGEIEVPLPEYVGLTLQEIRRIYGRHRGHRD